MRKNNIDKYAKLVVEKGLNIKKNRSLIITAPIESVEFIRLVTKYAYELGASEVIIDWIDDELTRLKLNGEDIENFNVTPEYIIKKNDYLLEKEFAFLKISATDPDGLSNVDPEKIMAVQKTRERDLKHVSDATMSDRLSWCVVSVPTLAWAKKVFPSSSDPLNDLWDAILKAVRCDLDDPINQWNNHINSLKKHANKLNQEQFDYLHFKNNRGTDLKVGLVKNHLWLAAESINMTNSDVFIANMPTEEVFTMPDSKFVEGVVYSSKPLNYQGNLIDDFKIEFKEGKVIKVEAKQGQDILEKLINIDEGASHLGEVALVSYNTPISLSNILFYNTLFDENASCHLALGRAYPTCLTNSENMTDKELAEIGCNTSAIHVDFMFGTEDLSVTGVKSNQEEIKIFENGNFI